MQISRDEDVTRVHKPAEQVSEDIDVMDRDMNNQKGTLYLLILGLYFYCIPYDNVERKYNFDFVSICVFVREDATGLFFPRSKKSE